jgi:hypothetical protein
VRDGETAPPDDLSGMEWSADDDEEDERPPVRAAVEELRRSTP